MQGRLERSDSAPAAQARLAQRRVDSASMPTLTEEFATLQALFKGREENGPDGPAPALSLSMVLKELADRTAAPEEVAARLVKNAL